MDGTLPGLGTEAEDDDLESHFCQASMLMFAQLMLCLSAAEPYYRKKITYAAAAAPRRCSRRGKLMGEEEAPVSEGEGPMDEEERERDDEWGEDGLRGEAHACARRSHALAVGFLPSADGGHARA